MLFLSGVPAWTVERIAAEATSGLTQVAMQRGGKAERVGLSAQIEIAFDPVFYAASNEFVWLTQLHDMTST